jgi:leucyl aminopeptidase (aminopeptidase T)
VRQDFALGARNAVRVCLNISGADRVAIVKDRVCQEIAEAIEEEARGTGAEVRSWTMEDHVRRPATEFPRSIGDDILKFRPTASYYIGTGQKGELAFRKPLLRLLADELGCRHGHMIGITAELMTDGMAADYEEIYRVTQQVWNVAKTASKIEVSTRARRPACRACRNKRSSSGPLTRAR